MASARLANQALRRKSSSDDSSAAIELENKLISERMIKTNADYSPADELTNPIKREEFNGDSNGDFKGDPSGYSSGLALNKPQRSAVSDQNDDRIGDRTGHQTVKRTSDGVHAAQQSDHRINLQPLHSRSKVAAHTEPYNAYIDSHTEPHTEHRIDPHETNQYSLQPMPGNQISELHPRSVDLFASLESDERLRKKRDFEQSTSQPVVRTTGELAESANMRKEANSFVDDSGGLEDAQPTIGSTDDGKANEKPAQLKDRLRNFVIQNSNRLLKSKFISQMPNCGQRICAILETLQMMGISVSTLTMAGGLRNTVF